MKSGMAALRAPWTRDKPVDRTERTATEHMLTHDTCCPELFESWLSNSFQGPARNIGSTQCVAVTGGRAFLLEWSSRMQQQRRRFTQMDQLEDRLAAEAKRLREEAELLRPGAVRDAMLRRARQAETGSHISEWLRSPGLRPPE
jgi:hypothetical protein